MTMTDNNNRYLLLQRPWTLRQMPSWKICSKLQQHLLPGLSNWKVRCHRRKPTVPPVPSWLLPEHHQSDSVQAMCCWQLRTDQRQHNMHLLHRGNILRLPRQLVLQILRSGDVLHQPDLCVPVFKVPAGLLPGCDRPGSMQALLAWKLHQCHWLCCVSGMSHWLLFQAPVSNFMHAVRGWNLLQRQRALQLHGMPCWLLQHSFTVQSPVHTLQCWILCKPDRIHAVQPVHSGVICQCHRSCQLLPVLARLCLCLRCKDWALCPVRSGQIPEHCSADSMCSVPGWKVHQFHCGVLILCSLPSGIRIIIKRELNVHILRTIHPGRQAGLNGMQPLLP
jgi:hypothetical protein